MEKLLYITKTLSRTKRKDYENYVVNAIWNRVNNPQLVPVTQQCVKADNGIYYFVDLYFPQLNIGIECDEQHHATQKSEDEQREITIFDRLSSKKDYVCLRIPVYEIKKDENGIEYTCLRAIEEVEKEINLCVEKIKSAISYTDNSIMENGWDSILDPITYYGGRDKITTSDTVTFRIKEEAYKAIFNMTKENGDKILVRRGGQKITEEMAVWFPEIVAIKQESGTWENSISETGNVIYEKIKIDDIQQIKKAKQEIGVKKVTFVKMKNPVTGKNEYRFAGVFECTDFFEDVKIREYRKISDEFEIIK